MSTGKIINEIDLNDYKLHYIKNDFVHDFMNKINDLIEENDESPQLIFINGIFRFDKYLIKNTRILAKKLNMTRESVDSHFRINGFRKVIRIPIELALFLPDHVNWTVMSNKNDENDKSYRQKRNSTRENQFGFIYINEEGILEFFDGWNEEEQIFIFDQIDINFDDFEFI